MIRQLSSTFYINILDLEADPTGFEEGPKEVGAKGYMFLGASGP